jgi:hypothetical protein
VQVAGREVPVFAGAVLAAPVASCLPVKVFVRPNVATVALEDGKVTVTPSVPSSVRLFSTVNVLLLVSVNVPLLVVSVNPLIVPGRTNAEGIEKVQVTISVAEQVPVAVI